ncbi:MAG: alpha/beta fold hydrolase [Arcticibacter sp.]
MVDKPKHISVHSGRITWQVHLHGIGPELIIAFHGFNRGYQDLLELGPKLEGKFRIAAISLFHHGSDFASAKDDDALEPLELRIAFIELIKALDVDSFSVMAHSFGGRLALNMVEHVPDGIKKLYLMAPDALRYHPGYRFITGTRLGRYWMGNFRKNPSRIVALIRFFGSLGIYTRRTADYFIHQITHEKSRELVYMSWMTHRKTIPNLSQIAMNIQKKGIKTHLIFGKNDTVIPVSQGERFKNKIHPYGHLLVLDSGHRLYEKKSELAAIILNDVK